MKYRNSRNTRGAGESHSSPSASRFHQNRRGGRFGGNRGGKFGGRSFSKHIDPSRFIKKAVVVEEQEVFKPEHLFADFAIDPRLKAAIAAKGYKEPTPIQDKSIPHILRGTDIVGVANTGTGKTAAFLIPLIHKALVSHSEKVLIIVPTRELAQQIDMEFRAFTPFMNMRAVCCVGGMSIGNQIAGLSRKPRFIIGTPGRLRDLVEHKRIDLQSFGTVVLDEADRMLDMGFIIDVKFMIAQMKAERHTLLFSATMSDEIRNLIQSFLKEPVSISVKVTDTCQSIDQDVVKVALGQNKLDILAALLRKPGYDKVLVFGKTKHGVEKLAYTLNGLGFLAESIHGNKSQSQRQRALDSFKAHKTKILVATDVAARGLDISGISHVINYDVPATYEDYVHRIGRTGRAGKKGQALTFI